MSKLEEIGHQVRDEVCPLSPFAWLHIDQCHLLARLPVRGGQAIGQLAACLKPHGHEDVIKMVGRRAIPIGRPL
ncbi:MAG: hypothetical protein QGH51_10535, partial [Planctomycetota bacterium]|nr:hypothetical protein [Planctomycetota bacterium]